MSILDELNRLRREGAINLLRPKRPNEQVQRRVFLTTEIMTKLLEPEPASSERMAYLRADLDRFTTGGNVVVGNKHHKTCFMKQLDPTADEVWEIRSRSPRPGLRLLGGFVETDQFIGLAIFDRGALGPEGSREWRDAILSVKRDWRRYFLAYPRHTGTDISGYLSKDAIDARKLP